GPEFDLLSLILELSAGVGPGSALNFECACKRSFAGILKAGVGIVSFLFVGIDGELIVDGVFRVVVNLITDEEATVRRPGGIRCSCDLIGMTVRGVNHLSFTLPLAKKSA